MLPARDCEAFFGGLKGQDRGAILRTLERGVDRRGLPAWPVLRFREAATPWHPAWRGWWNTASDSSCPPSLTPR